MLVAGVPTARSDPKASSARPFEVSTFQVAEAISRSRRRAPGALASAVPAPAALASDSAPVSVALRSGVESSESNRSATSGSSSPPEPRGGSGPSSFHSSSLDPVGGSEGGAGGFGVVSKRAVSTIVTLSAVPTARNGLSGLPAIASTSASGSIAARSRGAAESEEYR